MDLNSIDISSLLEGIKYLRPELVLGATLILLILQDLIKRSHLISFGVFTLGVIISLMQVHTNEIGIEPWSNLLVLDTGSAITKWIAGVAAIFTALMSLQKRNAISKPGEYYSLIVTILLGCFLAASSRNFLIIAIALEMISVPSYVLTGFYFKKKGAEGALKYFLFGAASTAIFLYGVSFFYGLTGGISLSEAEAGELLTLNSSLILIMAGILFKVAAVPMHIWLPDVYESAPTPVVAMFAVLPKIAGLVLLGRIALWYSNLFDNQFILISLSVIAVASMLVGNLSALSQNNIKRMLGYSTIAHSGFLLLGILSFEANGIGNMFFYMAIYTLMNYGAFALADHLEKQQNLNGIDQLKGLGRALPLIGVIFTIHMIALTGLPPTAGFMAKFLLFSGVWESFALTGNVIYVIVLVIAIINTVIALFYYIKIPFRMFLSDSDSSVNYDGSSNVYLSTMLAIGVLLLFFLPALLIEVFNNVNFVL